MQQIAIAKFFDGEAPDPVAEARAAQPSPPPPPRSLRHETLLNGSHSFPRSPRSPLREPAPRIVPQPEGQTNYRPPFVLSIFLTPFNLLYKLLSTSFSLFGYLFPFLPQLLPRLTHRRPPATSRPGRKSLNPRDTASRFARQFDEENGPHRL